MLRYLGFALFWPLAAFPQGELSERILAEMLAKPDRFEAFVAGVILGYGTARGVDADGIEAYLAVERSKIRVREMRRLMLADLDDDGMVTQAELFIVMSAQGAGTRGSLWQAYSAADADANGAVSFAEMQAQARNVAARAAQGESEIRALMGLDFDGDGFVSTLELRHAVTLIAPKT